MQNMQLIVADRDTGKTTYLLSEFNRMKADGMKMVVLDSATEHESKSLLRKVSSANNSKVIAITDPNQIVIDKIGMLDFILHYRDYFPFKELTDSKDDVICFDLSYFLEKGHDVFDETHDINQYNYYRRLYNNSAQQVAVMLMILSSLIMLNNCAVVMDEIEFPIVDYDVTLLQHDLTILAAVHPENSFGTFYSCFDKAIFKEYRKKED